MVAQTRERAPVSKQPNIRTAHFDVHELKVRVTSLEKQMYVRFEAISQENDVQFKAIMAAIAQSKAHAEVTNARVIVALSERVAVLEAQRD